MKDPCFDPETLAAWKDGLLAPAEAERLLDHAAACPSCRQEIAVVHTLPAAGAEPAEAIPLRTRRTVLSAVDRERISRRIHVVRSSQQPLGWVAGVAALLLLAIGALLLIRSQPSATEPEIPTTARFYPARPAIPRSPAPEPPVNFDPPVHPQVEPAASPSVAPAVTPEPVVSVEPEPTPPAPAPTPESTPLASPVVPAPSLSTTPAPAMTVVRSFDRVTITDFTAELALRRKGRKELEPVGSATQVGDGDVLVTEKSVGFFVLADVPVALMPKSVVGVARERSTGQLALTIEAGEAMVDAAAGSPAGWLVSDGRSAIAIDGAPCMFSAAIDAKALTLTALSGSLSGRDDSGRRFTLKTGERLNASATAWTTGPDAGAARKREALAAARPPDRTLFLVGPSTVRLLEGRLATERTPRGDRTFIRSVERKGVQSVKIDPAGPTCTENLVIRLRIMTNIQNLRFGLLVEDKTPLVDDLRLKREQLRTWTTVELRWSDLKAEQSITFSARDRLTAFSVTGRDQDVFGDDKGYILVDEVSFGVRSK